MSVLCWPGQPQELAAVNTGQSAQPGFQGAHIQSLEIALSDGAHVQSLGIALSAAIRRSYFKSHYSRGINDIVKL